MMGDLSKAWKKAHEPYRGLPLVQQLAPDPQAEKIKQLERTVTELETNCAGWRDHCQHQERTITSLRECMALQAKTIRELRAQLPSDPPQSDPDAPPHRGAVDQTIEALNKRLVSRTDRTRLRDAVDKADAPLGGRPGADQAVGRAIRFGR